MKIIWKNLFTWTKTVYKVKVQLADIRIQQPPKQGIVLQILEVLSLVLRQKIT